MLNNKQKIVLFGGAFSPFHLGHYAICEEINRQIKPDLFFLLPYKKLENSKKLIKKKHRIQIIKNSVKDLKNIQISKYELNKKTMSYSYLTVEHFKKKYPNSDLFFVLGTDSLNNFLNWEKPKNILNGCCLLHLKRKNISEKEDIKKNIFNLIKNKDLSLENKIYELSCDIPKVSSSKLMKKLNQFQKIENEVQRFQKIENSKQIKFANSEALNYVIKNFKNLY